MVNYNVGTRVCSGVLEDETVIVYNDRNMELFSIENLFDVKNNVSVRNGQALITCDDSVDIWMLLCVVVIVAVAIMIKFCISYHISNKEEGEQRQMMYFYDKLEYILQRKEEFLSNQYNYKSYGYRNSPIGYIDDWRGREFPGLLAPYQRGADSSTVMRKGKDCVAPVVYVDYAGAALPMQSQILDIYEQAKSDLNQIMSNPHSSDVSSIQIKRSKDLVLRFLNCDVAEYDVLFTSGSTEGLRIIANSFPWSKDSNFSYSYNSHTSVMGIRNVAVSKGATFQCLNKQEIVNFDITSQRINKKNRKSTDIAFNLLAFPLECNFGGDRLEASTVAGIVSNMKERKESSGEHWFALLDIAKASASGPIFLSETGVDFAVMSFYKLFGMPTGLGALIVKRSSLGVLKQRFSEIYFGGGSVDVVLPSENFAVARQGLQSFSNGTAHFRGIIELSVGFNTIRKVGGMEAISTHTKCLATEFVRRLRLLRHANGRKAIKIYGAWSNWHAPTHSHSNNLSSIERSPGPTVSINVQRFDGTLVGYSEVSNLASLFAVPLRFRTGCFCNTGACQSSLNLTNDQLKENFTSGHVCGDDNDLVNGIPTGAIRISFGKDSCWEDLDATISFLRKYFVNEKTQITKSMKFPKSNLKCCVSTIYLFPIKSCGPMEVKEWTLGNDGKLIYDREFSLVDSEGSVLRLVNCPKMALIRPEINVNRKKLVVRAEGCSDLEIDLVKDEGISQFRNVEVCRKQCNAMGWGGKATSDWFSSFLGITCSLVRYSNKDERPAFANEAPILMISRNSVDKLNSVLRERNETSVDPRFFRPNLVVQFNSLLNGNQCLSNPEDAFLRSSVKKKCLSSSSVTSFDVVGKCARCSMVDYDPNSGMKGRTLSALSEYRREKSRIFFGVFLKMEKPEGQYVTDEDGPRVSVGDIFTL